MFTPFPAKKKKQTTTTNPSDVHVKPNANKMHIENLFIKKQTNQNTLHTDFYPKNQKNQSNKYRQHQHTTYKPEPANAHKTIQSQ